MCGLIMLRCGLVRVICVGMRIRRSGRVVGFLISVGGSFLRVVIVLRSF